MLPAERAQRPSRLTTGRRFAALLLSCAVSWLLVTVMEGAKLAGSTASVWLSVAGLLAPVAFFGTGAAGLLAWLLEPASPWGVARLLENANANSAWGRRVAFAVALGCWAIVVGALLVGSVGLAGLTAEATWQRGAATLALAVLAVGAVLAGIVTWAVRVLGQRTAPVSSVALGLGAVLVTVSVIVMGETSGAGGPLGMWGVFRREELDLTLPLYGALMFVIGYQLPWYLARLPAWSGAVGVVVALVAFVRSAGTPSDVALQIERETRLASPSLRAYQKRSDDDRDGFAGRFGGGDCDDGSPQVNPEAVDVPGNGIDEDCSGRDATVTADVSPPAPSPPADASAAPPERISGLDTKDWNVVLISVDTLRHDLGFTGYHRPISPNIDSFAKRALVYERAYSLASYTSKSLAPMLIGKYGSETNRGWMHFNKYPEQDRMVQERLKGHGVFTLSVQGHWYFKADTGLGRGFDVLDMSAAPTRPQGEGDKTVNSEQLSDAAIALLQKPERAAQRLFMWVHYLDPHAEYVPHAEFDFGNNGRARYDGEIAFTDFHIGRLLQAIEQSPFGKRTVVIITSDHGEAFGEHGLIRHGFELWEELVRVPLLVYVPGQPPRRIIERRSAIDIVPTVLDVFGVPAPSGDDALSGKTLLPEWAGETPAARDVFIDMPAGPYNGDRQAFISGDWKMITSNSRPVGLYDLAKDPGETNNLVKDAALSEQHLERMKAFRSKLRVVKVKPQ